ncbi:MAG: PucR family transcriptional regulator ligand-binding domain-containing protein [Sporomusaceae bacterium]|nr:PucR family transcriptional regulator ligand-binding domain-containing protein [Sporomusaceae bacterium]
MVVKLADLLRLPALKECKLVAGNSGLERVLHWAHVLDLPDVMEWVQGGELLFTTGIGMRGNLADLPDIVRACYDKEVAGLVINVGPYIQTTPPEALAAADELGFPIFELPWEVKLAEVTRAIYNFIAAKQIEEKSVQDILENILYGSGENHEHLVARAASCDYDLTQTYQIMIVKFEHFSAYLSEIRALTEHHILVIKLQMQKLIQTVFEKRGKKALCLIRLDTALIMLPTTRSFEEQEITRSLAEEISQEFQLQFAGLKLRLGWGHPFEDIRQARKGLAQAEQAMRVAQTISGTHKSMGFDEIGFYKVLFNVQDRSELEGFRSEVLALLLAYDEKHGAELVNTLTVFLEENGNFVRVSERLFIHRNTLKYRLQKIVEITGRNLSDPKDRMLLYFATIVHQFLYL